MHYGSCVPCHENCIIFSIFGQFVGAPILRMVYSQTVRQGLFNLRFQINHQMLAVQKAQVPETAKKPIDQ